MQWKGSESHGSNRRRPRNKQTTFLMGSEHNIQRKERDLSQLNEQLSRHMNIMLKCTVLFKQYDRLLLPSPPENRYPYIYPRDTSLAVQLFRRLAGSKQGYDCADQTFQLMKTMAHFSRTCRTNPGAAGDSATASMAKIRASISRRTTLHTV